MDVLVVLLFYLSLLSIFTFIVLFFVKLIFKKGISKKMSLLFVALSIFCLIIMGNNLPKLTPEQKAELEERKKVLAEKEDAERKEVEEKIKESIRTFSNEVKVDFEEVDKNWDELWVSNITPFLVEDQNKSATVSNLKNLDRFLADRIKAISDREIPGELNTKDVKNIKTINKEEIEYINTKRKAIAQLEKDISDDKEIKDTAKYDEIINKGEKHTNKINDLLGELGERNEIKLANIIHNEPELIETAVLLDIKSKEEEEKKRIAEEKRRAEEKKKEEEEKKKKEEERKKSKEELDEVISNLIVMGEGSIKDIKPILGDDWSSVYIHVDNTWHLLTEEEQKYAAETIGPAVEANIIRTGIVDSCIVDFVDQNGNIVATQKLSGGYKIN